MKFFTVYFYVSACRWSLLWLAKNFKLNHINGVLFGQSLHWFSNYAIFMALIVSVEQ